MRVRASLVRVVLLLSTVACLSLEPLAGAVLAQTEQGAGQTEPGAAQTEPGAAQPQPGAPPASEESGTKPSKVAFGARLKATDGEGLVVTEVVPGSPAEKVGLEAKDVILSINGRPLRTEADYSDAVDASPPTMRFSVRNGRDGTVHELTVDLIRQEPAPEVPPSGLLLGARIRENRGDGMLVTEVTSGSPAEKAGLEPKDVIVSINDRAVQSAADCRDAVAASPQVIRLRVRDWRDGKLWDHAIQLAPPEETVEPPSGQEHPRVSVTAQYVVVDQHTRRVVLELDGVDRNVLRSLPELEDLKAEDPTGRYRLIGRLAGMGEWQQPGKPELPVFTATVKIPSGMKAEKGTVRFDSQNTPVWDDVWIAPARKAWPESPGAARPPRQFDRSTYAADGWYPASPVMMGPSRYVRGTEAMHVYVFPFRYNPVQGTLQVIRHLAVEVRLGDAPRRELADQQPRWSGAFADVYTSLVSNVEKPDDVAPATPPTDAGGGCDYLVFVPDDRSEAIEPLLAGKQKRQLKVRKVLLSELQASDPETLRSRIQARIRQEYTKTPSPGYLLLVGDAGDVPPCRKTPHSLEDYPERYRMVPTDLYYGNLAGGRDDLTPELLVGRLPARNAEELRIMVDKILRYEASLPADGPADPAGWGRVLVGAEYQNRAYKRPGTDAEVCVAERWFLETASDAARFLAARGFTVATAFVPQDPKILSLDRFFYDAVTPLPAGLEMIPADQASGWFHRNWDGRVRLVLHRGLASHAWDDPQGRPGWTQPPLGVEDVRALPAIPEDGFHPVVFSINGEAGFFDDPARESFAEELLRSPHGACGVIAATRVSFSGHNDRLAEGMMKAIWPQFAPASDSVPPRADELGLARDDPRLGAILEAGKARVILRYPPAANPETRLECEMFTLFGDPEMRVLGASGGSEPQTPSQPSDSGVPRVVHVPRRF